MVKKQFVLDFQIILSSISDRWTLALGGVLVLATFLRLFRLGKQGLFLDEAWSWMVNQMPLMQILQLPQIDPHPPLYYLILKILSLGVPESEAGLRLLSVLCSIIALALLMTLTARLWGKPAAFFSGLFLTLSSFDIYYAQEARMYALLGLLWLASYALLLEALTGRSRLFLLWGLVNAAMAWTHFYGLLVAGIHLALAAGVWGWAAWRGARSPLVRRWLIAGSALTILGALPVLAWLWKYRAVSAGGAWTPILEDFLAFFTLTSFGLTAARAYFLNAAHLTLPRMATIPSWLWQMGGILLGGGFSLWGFWQGWIEGGKRRLAAALAFGSLIIPLGATFVFAVVFARPVWAFKPFLGAAYLFYLGWGIGLNRLPSSLGRGTVVVLVLLISTLSLIPYYTTWPKTDATTDLRISPKGEGAVLLEPRYLAPLAFYYLGNRYPIFGLNPSPDADFPLVQVPRDYLWKGYKQSGCSASALSKTTDLWVYGSAGRVLQAQDTWPACLQTKNLWFLQDEGWTRLNP